MVCYNRYVAKQFSCIIPFYNKGGSLLSILTVFSHISYIKQIICVDDGSTNNMGEKSRNTTRSNTKYSNATKYNIIYRRDRLS